MKNGTTRNGVALTSEINLLATKKLKKNLTKNKDQKQKQELCNFENIKVS